MKFFIPKYKRDIYRIYAFTKDGKGFNGLSTKSFTHAKEMFLYEHRNLREDWSDTLPEKFNYLIEYKEVI